MIKTNNIELIKEFRNFLDVNCYDIVNQKIRQIPEYFFNPLPNYDVVKMNLQKLGEKKRVLFDLLLQGDTIKHSVAVDALGERIIEVLIELGVVVQVKDYIRTDGYILVSLLDNYFLVGTPFRNPNCRIKNPDVYIGMDTYRLCTNMMNKKVGKVLDLCTGSGIQAVFGSAYAESAVAVDINPKTTPVTKFNTILNDMENKIDVRTGSLYEPVGDEKFDMIYSNPPFIAVPDDLEFPLVGDGGVNGLDIVKDIVDGYKSHLNDNGYGIMIGEAIGDEEGPFLTSMLQERLGDDFEITVILDLKIIMDAQIMRTCSLSVDLEQETRYTVDQLFNKYKDLYSEINATSSYSFMVKAKKVEPGKGSLNVIDMTDNWNKFSVPTKNAEYQAIKINEFYGLSKDNRILTSVDMNALGALNECDGKRSIEEIFDNLSKANPQKYSMGSRAEFIESIVEVFSVMELNGILKRN